MQELTDILFLPIDKKNRVYFDAIYRKLSQKTLFKSEFKNFQSTDITGRYEDTHFLLYRDYKETNKFCIVFLTKENYTIICIDSLDSNNYFNECNYYSEINDDDIFLETSGLGKESSNYCKFKYSRNNRKYTICLGTEICNMTYKYEMTLEDKTGKSHVVCHWDNYESFITEEKPTKIEVCDKMKCILSNFTIINHNNYNYEDDDTSYELVKSLGLSLNCDVFRNFVKRGITVHDGIVKIIEKYLQQKKETDLIEEKQQKYYEENRKRICMTIKSEPTQENIKRQPKKKL